MEEIYKWLQEINDAHPSFDPVQWVPLTVRYPDKSIKELWAMVSADE
jgi:hypothetical protein